MSNNVKILYYRDTSTNLSEGYNTIETRQEDFGSPELYKKLFGVVIRYKCNIATSVVPFFYSVDGSTFTRFGAVHYKGDSKSYLKAASNWEECILKPTTRPIGTVFGFKMEDQQSRNIEIQSISYIYKTMKRKIG